MTTATPGMSYELAVRTTTSYDVANGRHAEWLS